MPYAWSVQAPGGYLVKLRETGETVHSARAIALSKQVRKLARLFSLIDGHCKAGQIAGDTAQRSGIGTGDVGPTAKLARQAGLVTSRSSHCGWI